MKTHKARWRHDGQTSILLERAGDGGARLAIIREAAGGGYTWRAGHAYGVADSRQNAQRAVRAALDAREEASRGA